MADKSSKFMMFLPDAKRVLVTEGETILETALRHRVPIEHSCGGMGSCGTCRVFVKKGLEKLDRRGEVEQEIADDRQFSENERLACQNQAMDGLEVRVPEQKKD